MIVLISIIVLCVIVRDSWSSLLYIVSIAVVRDTTRKSVQNYFWECGVLIKSGT